MTNEEAIFCLKGIKNIGHDIFTEQKNFQECLDMAIKALERESSEDAVSRKTILEWVKESLEQYANTYSNDMLNMWMLFEEQIKALPSVTPTRKKGKWIDGHCSECGCDVPAYMNDWKWIKDMDAKFCPICGAEMENVENDK
jgi:hypothetical protein